MGMDVEALRKLCDSDDASKIAIVVDNDPLVPLSSAAHQHSNYGSVQKQGTDSQQQGTDSQQLFLFVLLLLIAAGAVGILLYKTAEAFGSHCSNAQSICHLGNETFLGNPACPTDAETCVADTQAWCTLFCNEFERVVHSIADACQCR